MLAKMSTLRNTKGPTVRAQPLTLIAKFSTVKLKLVIQSTLSISFGDMFQLFEMALSPADTTKPEEVSSLMEN